MSVKEEEVKKEKEKETNNVFILNEDIVGCLTKIADINEEVSRRYKYFAVNAKTNGFIKTNRYFKELSRTKEKEAEGYIKLLSVFGIVYKLKELKEPVLSEDSIYGIIKDFHEQEHFLINAYNGLAKRLVAANDFILLTKIQDSLKSLLETVTKANMALVKANKLKKENKELDIEDCFE